MSDERGMDPRLMKAKDKNPIPASGRWIRPVSDAGLSGESRIAGQIDVDVDVDELATQLLFQTRKRVLGLAALERELENRIRSRWEETEAEVRRKMTRTDEDLQATRKRADNELKDAMLRGEKEGRAAGFREGFARGREEGYRLGYEEGRREGQREGKQEGKEEESRRLERELSGATAALMEAAVDIQQRKEKLLLEAKLEWRRIEATINGSEGTPTENPLGKIPPVTGAVNQEEPILLEARRDLLDLALTSAGKLVKREVERLDDVVVRNVEKAIDLIFRRGSLVLHVNHKDASVVEEALRAEPRWAQGFDAIEVRPVKDLARGGCRLSSGAGGVDMTLETQLSLIQSNLENAVEVPVSEAAPHSQEEATGGPSAAEPDDTEKGGGA